MNPRDHPARVVPLFAARALQRELPLGNPLADSKRALSSRSVSYRLRVLSQSERPDIPGTLPAFSAAKIQTRARTSSERDLGKHGGAVRHVVQREVLAV
jgi:hypothetical protein